MFESPVQAIADLSKSFSIGRSSRPRKCEAIVAIDGVLVARLPRGRWWTNWGGRDPRKYLMPLTSLDLQVKAILNALASLGVLSQADVDAHIAAAEDARQQICTGDELQEFGRLAKALGVKLPANTRRRIAEASVAPRRPRLACPPSWDASELETRTGAAGGSGATRNADVR